MPYPPLETGCRTRFRKPFFRWRLILASYGSQTVWWHALHIMTSTALGLLV